MKLIDKDTLVAEIENRIKNAIYDVEIGTLESRVARKTLNFLLSYIDTLEVKEVDLDKEIDREIETRWRGEYLFTSKFRESARHFFELGLKAQKGE